MSVTKINDWNKQLRTKSLSCYDNKVLNLILNTEHNVTLIKILMCY